MQSGPAQWSPATVESASSVGIGCHSYTDTLLASLSGTDWPSSKLPELVTTLKEHSEDRFPAPTFLQTLPEFVTTLPKEHSEHRFPVSSSKLCLNWLRHWRHTLSIAFRHLPPNSPRTGYAHWKDTLLYISAQLSTHAWSCSLSFVALLLVLSVIRPPRHPPPATAPPPPPPSPRIPVGSGVLSHRREELKCSNNNCNSGNNTSSNYNLLQRQQ